jgi:hypothetical protein
VSVPSADHPISIVFGDSSITEILLDCRFDVAPQAFFQVKFIIYLFDFIILERYDTI